MNVQITLQQFSHDADYWKMHKAHVLQAAEFIDTDPCYYICTFDFAKFMTSEQIRADYSTYSTYIDAKAYSNMSHISAINWKQNANTSE